MLSKFGYANCGVHKSQVQKWKFQGEIVRLVQSFCYNRINKFYMNIIHFPEYLIGKENNSGEWTQSGWSEWRACYFTMALFHFLSFIFKPFAWVWETSIGFQFDWFTCITERLFVPPPKNSGMLCVLFIDSFDGVFPLLYEIIWQERAKGREMKREWLNEYVRE